MDVCHTFSVQTDGDRTSPSQVILTDQIHCPRRVLPDQRGFLFALVFTDTPPSVTGEQDSHDLSTGMMKPDYLSYQILDMNLLQFKCETLYYHTWLCSCCMRDDVGFIIIVVAQYRAAGVNGSGEREWK